MPTTNYAMALLMPHPLLSTSICLMDHGGLDRERRAPGATGSSQTKLIVRLLCPSTSTPGLGGAPVEDPGFLRAHTPTSND
ncbi:hypothetical protein EYF80_041095 [Liparis tanakae]|uniref:Uncharacterized protein n=1 Tax=Liparis tanakae TaxID=230148 RepID=A0A4Z2G565_9TELE|nr:hypothetical protein EYF80_041095 [Liparis tanakae]